MLVCPVCKNSIHKADNKVYRCENRHSFDIHKSGYVNFLLSNKMHSKNPGDNKLMVDARRNFLNKKYYDCLISKINEMITEIDPVVILDAGCGEGYYTNHIDKQGRTIYGIDISKTALNYAAKDNKNIVYAVASIFDLPVQDKSIDLLINIFAPYFGDEFKRVIKDTGTMICVIPAKDHLYELKKIVYDRPYENEVKEYALDGFSFIKKESVHNKILINNTNDIDNLFKMTPYYYKTKKEDYEKILATAHLETCISFEILLYRREKS